MTRDTFVACFLASAALAGAFGIHADRSAFWEQGPMNLSTATIDTSPGTLHRPLSSLLDRSQWLNTPPLHAEDLRGKVVLVNFWTYSCINSLRPLPYLREWADRYGKFGLVVIGVHTPEFGFERDMAHVQRAVAAHHIRFPVLLDNDFSVWRQFSNEAWPSFYFIGADGKVHGRRLGEGDYAQSEQLLRKLFVEAGVKVDQGPIVPVQGQGIEVAPDWAHLYTPETYLGYDHAQNFAARGGLKPDRATLYEPPAALALSQWSLGGNWTVTREFSAPEADRGKVRIRFHARDLHLVMGLAPNASPVRFRITIDGLPPGQNAGLDVDAQGEGLIREDRLYQLVRQTRPVSDRIFEIEFEEPGARAFSFTFG